jgi:hypothetical protein
MQHLLRVTQPHPGGELYRGRATTHTARAPPTPALPCRDLLQQPVGCSRGRLPV